MGRDPRIVPPGSLQHVVDVVFQNRFLLRPSPQLNACVLGVLGRAQRKFQMQICAVAVLSNHLHLLLRPRDGAHLASFMCFLKTNLSKQVTRLQGWHGPVFGGRYRNTTISSTEIDQAAALKYVLSQGVKEGLVDRIGDWPGVHCGEALMDGIIMEGVWMGGPSEVENLEDPEHRVEKIVLSPLPCYEDMSATMWRQWVRELVGEIDHEAELLRLESGRKSLGASAILSMDPHHCPNQVERSPKRRFQVSDPERRHEMLEIWRDLVRAYREASDRFRSGDAVAVIRKGLFPEGTFPPNLPFIPFSSSSLQNPFSLDGAGHLAKLTALTTRGRP